jgi:hypothetical protein
VFETAKIILTKPGKRKILNIAKIYVLAYFVWKKFKHFFFFFVKIFSRVFWASGYIKTKSKKLYKTFI